MKAVAKKPASPAQEYATPRARWAAVLQNDHKADGQFYYAVKTTGVYCRPSCASRPPRRENVAFYESCAAAERAGFRACKRCQPDGPSLASQWTGAVAAACRAIESAEEMPSLDVLARTAGLSRFHFHRVFKKVIGVTPKAYGQAHRAKRTREALSRSSSVTEAIYAAGFNSTGRFYAQSAKTLGMTPKRFQRGGAGEAVRFAVGECSLGAILVAASAQGICAISLGDDPHALVRELQDRFPYAQLLGGDRKFERMLANVIGLVEAPRLGTDLPLDVRGTAFQQRVWNALQEIPVGETVSYTQLAKRVGLPKAVRAVASACAANTLAVAVPCHRVVRTDGTLSGYRWGVERKRALLKREGLGNSVAAPLSNTTGSL